MACTRGDEADTGGYVEDARAYAAGKRSTEPWVLGTEARARGNEADTRGYAVDRRGYAAGKRGTEPWVLGTEARTRGDETEACGYVVDRRGDKAWEPVPFAWKARHLADKAGYVVGR